MELAVLKIDGTQSGKKVTLEENVFGIEPNDHAVYLDVVQYLANQRHGNAKTKERSEIAHSTKKLGRQKGGGGARHGSLKANIFVGGGRVFGPKPRFYHNKLNKKVKALARKSALTYKAQENAIIVLEPFVMDAPKTKEEFLARLKGLTDALLDHPRFFGFCYTQLTDIEQEQNGLYTDRRVPKFDPAAVRAILSRPAAIEKE